MPPVIPEDILTALIIVVIAAAPLWLSLRWFGRCLADAREQSMTAARKRTRATLDEDSGDAGGMPGRVGDMGPIDGD